MSKRLLTAAAALAVAAAAATVGSQVLAGPLGYVIVSGRSMEPALHSGDLGFVLRQRSYRKDDIVAFRVPADEAGAAGLVIHRVTGGSARAGYRTQGDNRGGGDPWRPAPKDVIGKLVFHVPKAGLAPPLLASPLGLGFAAALLSFLAVAGRRNSTPRIARVANAPDVEPGLAHWVEPVGEPSTDRKRIDVQARLAVVPAVAGLVVLALAVRAVRRRRG